MRVLFLFVLLGGGCWDFDVLRSGGERTPDDPKDLAGADLVCQGTALVEDCADGIDNDSDCQVDCADSECSTQKLCQPVAGLLGYGHFVLGGMPATCPPDEVLQGPPTLYDGVHSDRQSCTGCTCAMPTVCTTELRLYSETSCKNLIENGKVALPGSNMCTALSDSLTIKAKSAIMDPPLPRCEPNSMAAQPEPAWERVGRLCLPEMAQRNCTTPSCILQQLRNRRACVAVADGSPCPTPFSERSRWYKSYRDSRTCTCICRGQDNDCEGMASLSDSNCMMMAMNSRQLKSNMCDNPPMNFTPRSVDYKIKPKEGARCNASGTVQQGMAEVSDPVSVCCLPAR